MRPCVRFACVISFLRASALGAPLFPADEIPVRDAPRGPYCELRCNGTAFGRWRMKNGKVVETLPAFTKEFDVFTVPAEESGAEATMRRWILERGLDLCMRSYCPSGTYRPGSYATRCRIGELGDSEIPVDGSYIADPTSPVHVLRCVAGY